MAAVVSPEVAVILDLVGIVARVVLGGSRMGEKVQEGSLGQVEETSLVVEGHSLGRVGPVDHLDPNQLVEEPRLEDIEDDVEREDHSAQGLVVDLADDLEEEDLGSGLV